MFDYNAKGAILNITFNSAYSPRDDNNSDSPQHYAENKVEDFGKKTTFEIKDTTRGLINRVKNKIREKTKKIKEAQDEVIKPKSEQSSSKGLGSKQTKHRDIKKKN